MGREMPRSGAGGGGAYVRPKSAKRTKKVTNDQPTTRVWFPERDTLGYRLEVLPYPPKHGAANDEKEAADAEPVAWADQLHNSLCDHTFTPHPQFCSISPMNVHFGLWGKHSFLTHIGTSWVPTFQSECPPCSAF